MYSYENERQSLFTDKGQRKLLEVRDNVNNILRLAGALRMDKAFKGGGDSWMMIACVDRLVEIGELRELTGGDTPGQYRVFVKAGY